MRAISTADQPLEAYENVIIIPINCIFQPTNSSISFYAQQATEWVAVSGVELPTQSTITPCVARQSATLFQFVEGSDTQVCLRLEILEYRNLE